MSSVTAKTETVLLFSLQVVAIACIFPDFSILGYFDFLMPLSSPVYFWHAWVVLKEENIYIYLFKRNVFKNFYLS